MAIARFRVTGAATTEVVAAVAAKQIRVHYFMFTTSAAATVSLHEGTDGATTRFVDGDFAANGGVCLQLAGVAPGGGPMPHFICSGNTALNITNSAGNLKGVVVYEQT
jgi:hypothetical protein